MERRFGWGSVLGVLALGWAAGSGVGRAQGRTIVYDGGVSLQLQAEVVASDEHGYPTAIRIELRNIGDAPVYLPMPAVRCGGRDGVVSVQFQFRSAEGKPGQGYGCVVADGNDSKAGLERLRAEWIELSPDHSFVFTEDVQWYTKGLGPGKLTYWPRYDPPWLTEGEKKELRASGYLFPEERVISGSTTVEGK